MGIILENNMSSSVEVIDFFKHTQANKPKNIDAQIKILAQNDRVRAMDALIRRYRDPLFYHALCILKNEDEAYDMVQEVFIRAIRESRLFNDDFKIKAWLYRVTSNLCFNQVRNRRRRAAILDAEPVMDRKEADQLSQVFAGERQMKIMTSMSKLSEEHQKILILRYYDDLSYAEIAQTLQIKLGTVMSRLSRARQRLQKVMEGSREMIFE
jgi:RNA polymerase sigma-70 factor (ECF subfamily)